MFHDNIIEITKKNKYFREVLATGTYSQLVVMSIPPGDEIGEEIHKTVDQIFFFVEGDAEAIVNDEIIDINKEDVVFVPAGAKHNIKNVGDSDLKLYTIYSPPEHPAKTIEVTKKK